MYGISLVTKPPFFNNKSNFFNWTVFALYQKKGNICIIYYVYNLLNQGKWFTCCCYTLQPLGLIWAGHIGDNWWRKRMFGMARDWQRSVIPHWILEAVLRKFIWVFKWIKTYFSTTENISFSIRFLEYSF